MYLKINAFCKWFLWIFLYFYLKFYKSVFLCIFRAVRLVGLDERHHRACSNFHLNSMRLCSKFKEARVARAIFWDNLFCM